MMKKFLALTLVVSLCLMLFPVPGYCGYNPWHGYDRTKLLQRELPYDLIYRGASRGGVSTIASQVSPLTASHIAFSLIYLESGSPGIHPFPDGEIGQEITIQLLADAGYTIADDTPGDMTMTGWTSIFFDSVNDWVTLTWLDDTYGWIITGAEGVVITY